MRTLSHELGVAPLDETAALYEQVNDGTLAPPAHDREAALESNLADLHHAAGSEEDAMEHLKRAVAIFSDVGADEATRLPQIWKLVSW